MKKYSILFLLLFFSFQKIFADHTKGGWMYYEYLGAGNTANTLKYRITLKTYTSCVLSTGQFNPNISFTIFNAGNNQQLYNIPVTYTNDPNIQNCNTQECHPCITPIPTICYKIITYELIQDLPVSSAGYVISYQRCCRIAGILNIQSPSNSVGETWSVTIPGTAIAGAEQNSSAKFSQNDTAIICQNNAFVFDFSATDINNDSLVYSFVSAYSGGNNTNNSLPNPSSPPPFNSVPYSGGFSGTQPMGNTVSINSQTGLVTGIAPGSGVYVITALVSEYRRGTNIKIAEVRKSLHIEVANCNTTSAELKPDYTSCDGFTVNFENLGSGNNIQTYYWEFGDGNSSTLEFPVHTYADTGIYTLKLVVNRGLPCSDSVNAPVKVYPGFFPGFTVQGQCKNTAIQFTDITTATYGAPNTWSWNFGDAGSPNNTANIKNPTHTYAASGSYNVTFIVTSNKGCIDTVLKTIDVLDKPAFTLSNDTLICAIDTLQLNAVGAGSFLWSPNYMISNINSSNPLVSPDVSTTYYVTITDPFGCVGATL